MSVLKLKAFGTVFEQIAYEVERVLQRDECVLTGRCVYSVIQVKPQDLQRASEQLNDHPVFLSFF